MAEQRTTMEMLGDIVASADSTHDLGATAKRFKNAYLDGLVGNTINLDGVTGSNILTITDNVTDALSIVNGGSDFVVLDTTNDSETFTILKETRVKAGKKLIFDAP